MLTQLYIDNIAVIERAAIDFEPGFTVLTGETGAGKSIIIDAIYAVLGERTSRELIRTGADQACVSALFTGIVPQTEAVLREFGIPLEEDGSLLIRREIRQHGKSSCKLNNFPATVSMLKAVGATLINILGQHECYMLVAPTTHIDYLDRFAGTTPLLGEYRAARTVKQLHGDSRRANVHGKAAAGLGALERRGLVPGDDFGRPFFMQRHNRIPRQAAGAGQADACGKLLLPEQAALRRPGRLHPALDMHPALAAGVVA